MFRAIPIETKQRVLDLSKSGFSYKEVAFRCGVSYPTVHTIIRAAEKAARRELGLDEDAPKDVMFSAEWLEKTALVLGRCKTRSDITPEVWEFITPLPGIIRELLELRRRVYGTNKYLTKPFNTPDNAGMDTKPKGGPDA